MELKIKNKNTIIENIQILYSISTIMVIFFQINNYKIILDINNFYNNIDFFISEIELQEFILFFINIILLFLFVKTGLNIINNKNSIFYYSILSVYQLINPILIFYIYYNNNKLNVSAMFNIFSVILNIISIRLIIRYKKIFETIEINK